MPGQAHQQHRVSIARSKARTVRSSHKGPSNELHGTAAPPVIVPGIVLHPPTDQPRSLLAEATYGGMPPPPATVDTSQVPVIPLPIKNRAGVIGGRAMLEIFFHDAKTGLWTFRNRRSGVRHFVKVAIGQSTSGGVPHSLFPADELNRAYVFDINTGLLWRKIGAAVTSAPASARYK